MQIFQILQRITQSGGLMKLFRKSWNPLNILASLWLVLMMVTAPAGAAIIKTDIVMIVDESGSMGNVHNSIGYGISAFAEILQAGGLDVQFALIGYGFAGDSIRLISDFVDATAFSVAVTNLYTIGADEPAYDATAYALDALESESPDLSYRDDAVKNLILFADEASNGDLFYDADSLDTLLQQSSALFNVVLGGEHQELIDLALNNGGQMFDLNLLDTTNVDQIDTFVASFAEVKLNETLEYCEENPDDPACSGSEPVSSPAGIGLMAGAILVLAIRRRFWFA